jgi:ATP-dependent DNA ligase
VPERPSSPTRDTATGPAWPGDVGWQPQPFGRADPNKITNPLIEPHWPGLRSLALLADGRVSLRDEWGEERTGFDQLREAIVNSLDATVAVLDGYLVPAPIRSTEGVSTTITEGELMTAGRLGRQLVMGAANVQRLAERQEAAERAAILAQVDPAGATAFIAVDLLWLDEDSLLDVPLMERKRLLEAVVGETDLVRRAQAVRPPAELWFVQWRAMGFTEMTVKSANSRYTPGMAGQDWAIVSISRRR